MGSTVRIDGSLPTAERGGAGAIGKPAAGRRGHDRCAAVCAGSAGALLTTKMRNGFVIGLALILSLWSFNRPNAMVGGTVHPLGFSKFPATIKIRHNCTGAKIGPRTFLTAGHCVIDGKTGTFMDMFKAGGKIDITNNPLPLFDVGFVTLTVEDVFVDTRYALGCSPVPCDYNKMRSSGPDLAIIRVIETTPLIPTASIDPSPVIDDTPIVLNGFGCEDYNNRSVPVPTEPPGNFPSGRLSSFQTKALDAARTAAILSPGIPNSFYFYTPGRAVDSTHAGLCPGDSGGPVYLNDSINMTIVGVNSSLDNLSAGLAISGYVIHFHSRLSQMLSSMTDLIR